MDIVLVGNNGYTVQDNPEPERWVRPLVAAGLVRLEFFADHMDPLFARDLFPAEHLGVDGRWAFGAI